MVQENRGLDHCFGALPQYRAKNGIPGTFDGLPQFNTPAGATASNPGCDPSKPFQQSPAPFNDCVADPSNPIASYALITQCVENPSPSWNESHVDWNVSDPLSPTAIMDGFVQTAGHDVRELQYVPGSNPPESDVNGIRVANTTCSMVMLIRRRLFTQLEKN
jgi:phospholipase C